MITVDTAADIARRYGLSLTDAQALAVLADDERHAERLARKFSTPTRPQREATAA